MTDVSPTGQNEAKAKIEAACRSVTPIDATALLAAENRQLTLTKPTGSLGRLEEIGNRLAAIRGLAAMNLRKRIYVVAGDHGVTAEGVSAYPKDVTYQMVYNFLTGGAAITVLGRHGDIDIKIVDAGVDYDFPPTPYLIDVKVVHGTANFVNGPAMTREQAQRAIVAGIDLAGIARDEGIELLGIGEMGIGNTTAASAVTSVLTRLAPALVTGAGTGLNESQRAHKISVIERALAANEVDATDPIDVLAKFGGAEFGVMMGIVIGAAAAGIPVVSDGFISTTAAALAVSACPAIADYLMIAHKSQEPGHQALIDLLGISPLLDLNMRLGEGTGAALAMHLIEAAGRLLTEMATFSEAGVSDQK